MKKLKILYLGVNSGTCRHRALALQRLGHDVLMVDPSGSIPSCKLVDKWLWETGGLFLSGFVRRQVVQNVQQRVFDLGYVDGGALVGPALVKALKKRCKQVVNYNIDDPYGTRDRRKWRLYLQAVPLYDTVIVVRECNIAEAYQAGAKRVVRVTMSADEIAHSPRVVSHADQQKWRSEVVFVGTWMPERGPFLKQLLDLGVPLSIYGDRWQKAQEWAALRNHWRGQALPNDDEYAGVLQSAKVCLCLLSKGNRDLSTTRSFEVPHLGSLLCAERTPEHERLYREGEEAVFWETADECAKACIALLHDHALRTAIAERGRTRCLRNGTTNELMLTKLLSASSDSSGPDSQ